MLEKFSKINTSNRPSIPVLLKDGGKITKRLETGEVLYKKSKINSDPKSSIIAKHEEYIERLIDQDPQLFAKDIIEDLAK
ncbi:hypothetical protein BDF21DRAFT_432514 [Thamnidium elegans]|nr:hypothetical protein BDF21DRAFT_432514 [Thamnidium elegans]